MLPYKTARAIVLGLLHQIDGLQDEFTDFWIRKVRNWRLKHKCLRDTDIVPQQFKKNTLTYWKRYIKKPRPNWQRFYSSRRGICDVRYIPDDLYYTKIDRYFNNRIYASGIGDKNYICLWFCGVKQPKTVIRRINGILYNENYEFISEEEATDICAKFPRIIIKPAIDSGGGKGIKVWETKQGLDKLLNYIHTGPNNMIMQEVIKQHPDLAIIHPSSVNTVRIISLLFNAKIHILSSVLRMGVDGNIIDNASVGGITCGIKKNGQLKNVGYSAKGVKYDRHPQGFEFHDCIVPSYDRVLELVKEQHRKMAHFQLISWDIAIDADGEPVLIEANLKNGELDFHQFNNGPLFGDLTDEVLTEIFVKKENSVKKGWH